jgi:hypothetical protein
MVDTTCVGVGERGEAVEGDLGNGSPSMFLRRRTAEYVFCGFFSAFIHREINIRGIYGWFKVKKQVCTQNI